LVFFSSTVTYSFFLNLHCYSTLKTLFKLFTQLNSDFYQLNANQLKDKKSSFSLLFKLLYSTRG